MARIEYLLDFQPISSVGFLLVPGFALMSYASAVEALRAANTIANKPLYRWRHASPGDVLVTASNGVAIVPDMAFGSDHESLDVMFVCAGGNPTAFDDPATFAWLRRLARHGVVIGGISGGPVILANAGLLTGRRCTVHWEHMPAFREAFPDVELVQTLFEMNEDTITCAGGIASLDMMVALIRRDHGSQLAAEVSEWFLHTHIREGIGPQRMDLRVRLGVTDKKLLLAMRLMEANIETPLPREELATRAHTSIRQLERLFRKHLQRGIHQHYLRLRLERSRQLLRETSLSVLEVSLASGFGSPSQFSRAFRKVFGLPPRQTAGRLREIPNSKLA